MQHEHTHGDDVGIAQVVDKAADVTIVTGVDTVHLTVLRTEQLICKNMFSLMFKLNNFPNTFINRAKTNRVLLNDLDSTLLVFT